MRGKILSNSLKGLTIFLILVLGLGFPASAFAQETTTVSVSPSSESIGPGEEFTVNIVVEPKAAVAGVQFDLSFDPALVTVDKVEEGYLLTQGGASTYFNSGKIDNEVGSITGVAGAITEPGKTVSSAGTFAVITLTAKTKEGSCALNLSKVIVGDKEGKPVPTNVSNSEVVIEETTPSPAPTPTPTPSPILPEKPVFRVGPVVKLRPVNDVIDPSKDGLVELFFSNPSLNEVTLQGDMYVSVPSGIHVYGEGFGLAGAAGTVYGQFSAPPGTARTIYLNIKADETAAGKTHFIHFEGMYWPDDNKDAYNPVSLTHPFKVIEASSTIPPKPVSPNGEDGGIWMGWWIILAVVILGGIATVVAVMARRTEVSIEK